MHFSLEQKSVTLSVGDFANFSLGPQESSGGPQGLWRAQLGQQWHQELRVRTEREFTVDGVIQPGVEFEVAIEGRLIHRGWNFDLSGRIDQIVPLDCRAGSLTPPPPAGVPESPLERGGPQGRGVVLREIKSVLRPLPAGESELRADYPEYFRQLATYVIMRRTQGLRDQRAELVFVEAGSGIVQTIALTPFDEALVFHQLDALVEFLNLRLRAAERRRSLRFHSPFPSLRPGQETIQADLQTAFLPTIRDEWRARSSDKPRPESTPERGRPSTVLLFEAPTGYGKTGCVLEFALGQLKAGRFERLIWLTGKSTGQIQVVHTLRDMSCVSELARDNPELPVWQVRNKAEHCVNHTFHCVRDGCNYLRDCAERWPGSGLSRFYLDDRQPRDLDTLRTAGRDAGLCPYEITRAALPFNDVWIGDFNYVFAPDNRGLFYDQPGFDPADTLLVIDEAHNLPSRVAGAHSHRATESDARLLLAELDHLQAPTALVLAVEDWIRLLASLQPCESLEPDVEAELHDLLDRLTKLTATHQLDHAALGPKHSETLWSFAALAEFLADRSLAKLVWVARTGQLEFTCVDAAAAIGETLKPYGGVILMSATLQPYPEFAASCGLEVGRGLRSAPLDGGQGTARPTYTTLNAPTPWRAGAYDVAVDLRVDTTYRQRANHYGTTAATIVEMQAAASARCLNSGFGSPDPGRQTPDPKNTATPCVAVFFPSYAYAEAVLKTLTDYGSVLRVALQPRGQDLAAQTSWVEEHLVFSDVLFLVLGSSFAEGIDLIGGRVTHAMVVGPALPEVNAVQKARLHALSDLGRDAAFRRVYQIPGLQKVNQGLGRLVRAPGQKAKVLLHCRRFAEPAYASLLATDYQMFAEVGTEAELKDWLFRP